jgi:type VI secretion system protein ImpJ
MSWNNKVIWTEGMFLRPQHFQQQDRNVQTWVESRCGGLHCFSWGITKLEIDQQLLTLGKFSITSCQGIFPDGTPFNIPEHHPLPTPLEIPATAKNEILFLALPVRRNTGKELSWENSIDELSRYRQQEIDVRDLHSQSAQDSTLIQSGELWTRFRLASQNPDAYVTIPVTKIIERKSDNQIILDTDFIPTCLHISGSAKLSASIQEIQGILHHRGESLAKRLGAPGAGGVAEIVDFLLLQIINRYEPLFIHFTKLQQLHPETLYRFLISMVAELSTMTRSNHRPETYPDYKHENLQLCFEPVIKALHIALSWVSESRAIPIPLEKHKNQIHTAIIHDHQLLQSAEFVLAVSAQVPTAKLSHQLPRQTTIATVEKLRDLVMSQVSGIKLNLLSQAPRQIPFHKGMTYFELDKNHELWEELIKSGTIAIHFSGDYPGMELELWAIRG